MTKFSGAAKIFSGNPFIVDEANPTHNEGELIETADGRRFRYVRAGGTALVVGNILQSPAEVTADQNLAVAAASVGATQIVTTTTVTITANQYVGGYIVVTVTPGLGQMFKIKSHLAYTAAAATFEIEDPVQVALTTSSRIDLVTNPYRGVIQNPATATGCVVGVAVNDLTANQYGWIQTGGLANVLSQGALTVGNLVVASNGTAGAVENAVNASTEAQAPVGVAASGVASGENGAVFLNLD